ncbi:hypothetical protein ACIGDI_39460 [Streptomyces sp. NPDC085900]|uniref:hypothetical protein n=1 Tax=Streptomyces sp. NPDC085900 TaxID=3365737 RepID=UPI0037D398A3
MLLDPPGRPGWPQELPHWPYVKAVDAALLARGIPPGVVRANLNSLRWGLTGYMLLQWDASRTHGHGGIRLNWEERKGWSYALLGLSPDDVLLSSVLVPVETSYADPEAIADVAQELVMRRRLPQARYRTEWPGAKRARAAASDFRRIAFGLPPLGSRMGEETTEGQGVQLIINTQRDTYEQAIAAVQAAYGFNPAPTTGGWPEAPALEPRPGPQDLSEDDLWQGWSERMLFDTIAALMPGARTVLRHIADVGGTATYDDVQAHFTAHPDTPIPKNRIGGTLTSVRAVRRRIGPDNNTRLLELDDRVRVYRIEPALLEGLQRAFALADARPDLLRQDPVGSQA